VTATALKVPPLPVPVSTSAAITRLLTVAASQIGYHEGRTKAGSWNNDTVYGLWYGLNFNAWCHMYLSWCAEVAGKDYTKIIPHEAYTPRGFNWFAKRGLADGRKPPSNGPASGMGKPRRGDIMYVHGKVSGEWRIHHVGIVENVLGGGKISTIEGNTNLTGSASGDGVYRLTRTVSSRLFFCHPQYAAVVTAAKPPAVKPGGDTPVNPPKDDDMWTPEAAEKIEKRYTLAFELWHAQTAAERAVSDALAAKLLAEGKLNTTQIIAEVEKIWKPTQVSLQQALDKLK
jgi:hypothetical protein